MLFDGKQTEFQSEVHEHIWALGKRIIPLEISTAGFTDKEMLEGLRQIYDFSVELFTDMYKDPDKYKISFGKKTILEGKSFTVYEGKRDATFIHHYLGDLVWNFCIKNETGLLSGNNWIIKTEYLHEGWEKDFFEIFDILEPMGIFYENNSDGTITLKSSRYPLFFKYLIMFVEAGAERKMGVSDYINSCDFRVLNKQRKTTIDDTARVLSESNKVFVLELHNHLISKKVKRKLSGYNCHYYSYKNENVLRIQNDPRDSSMYLDFHVYIGNSQNDETFKFMLSEIEILPDKDDLLKYISDNINCCTLCNGHRVQQCGANKWEEFLGEQKLFCWAFKLNVRRYSIRNNYYNEHDIKMLKQIMDLRIKTIDSLTT